MEPVTPKRFGSSVSLGRWLDRESLLIEGAILRSILPGCPVVTSGSLFLMDEVARQPDHRNQRPSSMPRYSLVNDHVLPKAALLGIIASIR